jgi:lysophospholipase L1-like esterase
MTALGQPGSTQPGSTGFADFDARASAGEPLSVVFFGGSLTWGANASDPQLTSYRALMGAYLRKKYPRSAFTFWDAAIGGTGSRPGVFRLDRDVLSRKPDLVFLDFTANDGLEGTDPLSLHTYESILRRLIGNGIPVEQVFLGFESNFGPAYDEQKMPRRHDHLKLAQAYHTGIGDCFPYVQQRLTDGSRDIKTLWPFDGAHPDDPGYQLFFEAVRNGFDQAIADKRVCVIPDKPVFGDDFLHPGRIVLVDLPQRPRGWSQAKTYRTSMWFDGLSSRWMGDVLLCDLADRSIAGPLKVQFEGTFVGLFGEGDADGLPFKVKIDGVDIPYRAKPRDPPVDLWPGSVKGGGRLFIWRELAGELPPGKHLLEVGPVFPDGIVKGQLRLESVCAGGSDH